MKKRLQRVFATSALVLAVLAAAPYLVPLGGYIPEIERRAGEALRHPVSVAKLRLVLLPVPGLHLGDISVGKSGGLRIGTLVVVPNPFTLFSSVREIRRVEIRDAAVDRDMLSGLAALGGGKADGEPAVRVRRVNLESVKLKLPDLRIPPLNGDLRLSDEGSLEKGTLETADGSLRLAATADGSGSYRLKLDGANWIVPAGPPLKMDQLRATGTLNSFGMRFDDVRASLYGGSLKGAVALDWKKGWVLKGDAETAGVELAPVLPLIGMRTKASGKLDSATRFTSRAPGAAGLGDVLRAEGRFDVRNGVLHNLDIAGAAKAALTGGSAKGGETRFDQLSGTFVYERGGYRIKDIDISSGVLAANGHLNVSPAKELSGKITAELKAGVSLVGVPLAISGVAGDPVLRPTGAAVAGGAAGTAVLGPGFGTALGVKAGDALDRLFGDDKK